MQRSSVLTDAFEVVEKKRAFGPDTSMQLMAIFGDGPETMISSPLGTINHSKVRSWGVPLPPQRSRYSSKIDGQSSLETAKGGPEENNRLMSRSQSEEDEMLNEITSSSRRTLAFPFKIVSMW